MRLLYVSDKSATLTNKYGDELELSKYRMFVADPYNFTIEDSFHISKENFEKLLKRCEVQNSKRDKYENLIEKLNHIAGLVNEQTGQRVYLTDIGADSENAIEDFDIPFNWDKANRDRDYIGWDSMYQCALDSAAYRLQDLKLDINDYGIRW